MSTKKGVETNKMSGNFQELLKQIKSSNNYEIEVVRDLISEQIFNVMQAQQISKAELARKLQTSAPYITKLLQGNGNFTLETLVRIATALGCKFRPVLIPVHQSWKVMGEYANSANFQSSEQRITQKSSFKSSENLVNVDLDNCGIAVEEANNERLEHITG